MWQGLPGPWPEVERLMPPYDTTDDGWIVTNPPTANNISFRTQVVECQYPISGGYGLTPRIVFYALAAVSIFGRGHEWVVGAALGVVMIFSSTAAVHALILVGIRHQLAPSWLFPEYQTVLVESTDLTQRSAPLWFPIIPMAWDQDCDPTLLITGVAFLLLLPMYNFSKTLKKASKERQLVIVLWALLLFAGLIAALVNSAYVFFWSFPQLRFCPLDQADDLPIQNDGAPSVAGPWDGHDAYMWNRTVRDYFVSKNATFQPTRTCLYPCFDRSWPLRDPTDIQVFPGNIGAQFQTPSMIIFQIAVYALVSCSAASCITLAMMKHFPWPPRGWDTFELIGAWNGALKEFGECLSGPCGKFDCRRASLRLSKLILRVWIFLVVLYSFVLNPLGLVAFVSYYEWAIADTDPGGETFWHVGQWSPLVMAVLALGAATIPRSILRIIRKKKGCRTSFQGA